MISIPEDFLALFLVTFYPISTWFNFSFFPACCSELESCNISPSCDGPSGHFVLHRDDLLTMRALAAAASPHFQRRVMMSMHKIDGRSKGLI
jgi:hypothetical protein